MRKYKHDKQWYVDIHNTIAGCGLILLMAMTFVVLGIMEAML